MQTVATDIVFTSTVVSVITVSVLLALATAR
jgi:hypothetical protein